MRNSILPITLLLLPLLAAAQTFQSGNTFTATIQYGQVTIMCPPVPSFKPLNVFCQRTKLEPTVDDIFLGPNVDADTVTLSSDQGVAGGYVKQAIPYSNGQSAQPFNLWTTALFQTPLLGIGTNHIQYSMSKGTVIGLRGSWVVQVSQNPTQNCKPATISGETKEICNDPYTSCETYFTQTTCPDPTPQ